MTVRKIKTNEIGDVARLASEIFVDDHFYLDFSSDRNTRLNIIKNIFYKSISICVNEGFAYLVEKDDNIISFILGFDYYELMLQNPKSFSIFFENQNSNINNSLKSVKDYIDENIVKDSKEYLYILAIGVVEEYRRQGIASNMVQLLRDTYLNYNIFSDVSNNESLNLYKKLGFNILDKTDDVTYVRYITHQDDIPLDKDNIYLGLPINFDQSMLFDYDNNEIEYVKVNNFNVSKDSFVYDLGKKDTKLKYLKVSYHELLIYQRYLNILNVYEIKYEYNDKVILLYVRNNDKDFQRFNNHLEGIEKDIIPDVYTCIPISYHNEDLFKNQFRKYNNYLINRILSILDFRTNDEAGIPIKNDKSNGFKNRLKRYYIGNVKMQIQTENTISFNGIDNQNKDIGSSYEVALLVTIDELSNCGVLTLISLSCGLALSNYLDSISRNQINIIIDNNNVNLYEYLNNNYKISKKGSPKNFVTIPKERNEIPDDLLASLLYCETYYSNGEVIGSVIDKEIVELVKKPYGEALYNYAHLYGYSNISIQITPTNIGKGLYERVLIESYSLFYFELILLEEASYNIINDEILEFLSVIDKHSPIQVIKKIDFIYSEHMKTLEFLNIQMNYPSSNRSLELDRKAFKMDELAKLVERNISQLNNIYNTRSDIIDKLESSILTTIGAVLTVVSIVSLFTEENGLDQLFISAFVVGVLLILKRIFLVKNKRK